MGKLIGLAGQRFGRLVVIKRVENNKWGKPRWLCLCDCKNEVIVLGNSLRIGVTKSCGCLRDEATTKRSYNNKYGLTHGHSDDKIHLVWTNMIQRCTKPNHKQWEDYGGRGIRVCQRWSDENGFIHFIEDMIEKYEPGLTLERKKNWLGYSIKNCYWGTWKQQARNRRSNRPITCFGRTQLLIEWSEETGISINAIRYRLKHGWPTERALTTPVKKRRNQNEA